MILVIGATGNVGSHLVNSLSAAGEKVIAVSRRPATFGPTVRHLEADVSDRAAMTTLWRDAEAVFLLGGIARDSTGLITDAHSAGVRRVVLLSSLGAGTRPQLYRAMRDVDDAVRQRDWAWTVLRPSGFASNTLMWADTVRTRREVFAPYADVAMPVIDPVDVAEVAAHALLEDGHAGRIYTLTGPQQITPRQQADAIGTALGAAVRFIEQSRQQALETLVTRVPRFVAEATLTVLGDPLPSEQAVSAETEVLLGRPGRTFTDWVTANIEAFR
jgi:uncharacterized protein YbjT (DUF2867 family)